MYVPMMKFKKRSMAVAVILAAGLSLSGCVVYPSGYGYGYGGGSYYSAPAYYAPPPVSFGFGYYGGGRGWGGHDGGWDRD